MKVTDRTRRVLACRQQAKRLTELGYRRHETDWEVVRGGRTKEVIVDAVVAVDGKSVWTKIGPAPRSPLEGGDHE